MLYVILLQDGVYHIQVDGRHMDVHINTDGHQLRALGAPEVELQMAPKPNTWACWDIQISNPNRAFQALISQTVMSWKRFLWSEYVMQKDPAKIDSIWSKQSRRKRCNQWISRKTQNNRSNLVSFTISKSIKLLLWARIALYGVREGSKVPQYSEPVP